MAVSFPTISTYVDRSKHAFKREFKKQPKILLFAPGRINVIGDCLGIDDGCTISMGTPAVVVIAGRRSKSKESTIILLEWTPANNKRAVLPKDDAPWLAPIRVLIEKFQTKWPVPGFNVIIDSSLPTDCGMANNSALQVCFHLFLEALCTSRKYKCEVGILQRASICYQVDSIYSNNLANIADPLSCMVAQKDHLIFIDSKKEIREILPFSTNVYFLIINVTKLLPQSDLALNGENIQKQQLLYALGHLQKESFQEVTIQEVEELKNNVIAPIADKAYHVVTEIKRCTDALNVLRKQNFKKLGQLMTESFTSFRDNFEVSCPEVEEVVKIALSVKSVFGVRWSGAHNCVVVMLQQRAIAKVIQMLKKAFSNELTFYKVQPGKGAGKIVKSRCRCDKNPMKQCTSNKGDAKCECAKDP